MGIYYILCFVIYMCDMHSLISSDNCIRKKKMKKKEEISGCFQKKEQISPSVPGKLGEVEEPVRAFRIEKTPSSNSRLICLRL